MPKTLAVVILAAGQGSRMRSRTPKVLHEIGGRPMLTHVLDTAADLQPASIHVVYGHGGRQVPDAVHAHPAAGNPDRPVQTVYQDTLDGTGGAVARALPAIPDDHRVLVLCGDVPLIQASDLAALAHGDDLALLTAVVPDPSGYGRIVRTPEGAVTGIVEHRDADPETRAIQEINSGIIAAPAAGLRRWLAGIHADNAQKEYYLTDAVGMAAAEGDAPIRAVAVEDPATIQGVNDQFQRAQAERAWQWRAACALMRAGLCIHAPERLNLRGRLTHGQDCVLESDVTIEGSVELEDDVRVGTGAVLRDSRLRAGARIDAYSVVEGADVGSRSTVGPFARLRSGTTLAEDVRIGNFVETKNAAFAAGSKANHLAYVGDAGVGARANLGAGTITCNYDGRHKHRTEIGEDAFVGSDTQLVAPVRVGPRARIGAGTTLTRDAPPDALTLSRVDQWTAGGPDAGLTRSRQPSEHEGGPPAPPDSDD